MMMLYKVVIVNLLVSLLFACGGSGAPSDNVFSALDIDVEASSYKVLDFTWTDLNAKAESIYSLSENLNFDPNNQTNSGFIKVNGVEPSSSDDKTLGKLSYRLKGLISDYVNARYIISDELGVREPTTYQLTNDDIMGLIGRIKDDDPGKNKFFGQGLALSADGRTLVVGAPGKNFLNNDSKSSGGVYIYSLSDADGWYQSAYLNPPGGVGKSNIEHFGASVALSEDGTTLAVSSPRRSYNDEANEVIISAGAVYVFTLSNGDWQQERVAHIKANDPTEYANFGAWGLSLSSDGKTLAVSGFGKMTQIGQDLLYNGVVYVFSLSDEGWQQMVRLTAPGSDSDFSKNFGVSIELSEDGKTLVVGSDRLKIVQANGSNFFEEAGAVYVFSLSNEVWQQTAYIEAGSPVGYGRFGSSVALNSDATVLAVGAMGFSISIPEIDYLPGSVYIFNLSDEGSWEQAAHLVASNADAGDGFGKALDLSRDGDLLVVGSFLEDSKDAGINVDQSNNDLENSGAVYIFSLFNGKWQQISYVKSSNLGKKRAQFGRKLALSSDENTLAVSAFHQDVNGFEMSGAVYTY